jgi:RHH-type proline utilization regulon transcriptional repressor/proline dehydrogenase/delta 1-pyrroline-5-carboxylate dehydrogenase
MEILNDEFDREVIKKGEAIFKIADDDSTSIFNKDWWYGRIMDWSMRNEQFKIQMFRFVDVLPYLNSGSEVARHLKEYFSEMGEEASSVLNFGLGVGAIAPGITAALIKKNVVQMAKMFITGETPKEAISVLKKTRDQGLTFTADLLGEATLSEKEALHYQTRYMELMTDLAKSAVDWAPQTVLDNDDRGPIPRVNVSIKLTALYSQVSEKAWDESIQILKERLRPLLKLAVEKNIFVNIDMEQYRYKDMTIQVFKEILMEPEFKSYAHFGIVVQAYLREAYTDLVGIAEFAKMRGTPVTIRLVKGAYWDFETIHSEQQGWHIPVYTNKRESDHNFEKCMEFALKNHQHVRLAAGTHNVRSIAATMVMAEKLGVDKRGIEFQMLYGMAEPIKRALVKQGFRVREYATIGELIPGMAYLVRRLLENTSNESFLRNKFADNMAMDVLLKNPGRDLKVTAEMPEKKSGRFYNEPLLDFCEPDNRSKMKTAIQNVASANKSRVVRPIINGKVKKSGQMLERFNPSQVTECVGKIELADIEMANEAVSTAKAAWLKWKKESIENRSKYLKKLADLFRRDRFEIIALQIAEVGKNWTEADGDVGEAIDFCDYYAKSIFDVETPERVSFVGGEDSKQIYQSRGVSLVIAPWNFPLAILTGQVAASIVTGNTCVMKPAEQSSLIAGKLMDLIQEAGVPAGVVNFVPGLGETVGRHLVNHPDVSLISFTGSKNVGLEILKSTTQISPDQSVVKRCIIEMGGKNAVIVDSDADLDEAVVGVMTSAFGFQGQKCSACSRAIVLEENYDRFLDRLVESSRSLIQGPANHPHSYMGPVIDQEAYERILKTIESAKSTAKMIYQGPVVQGGYYVPPTIFADVDPKSSLAQEEIFGPVLAVIRAKDLDHAIAIANGTKYALTGGLFSRSPANIERVKAEYECGNLYVNRGITGAMVGRHPFGGYKMSGLGSKTGGKHYLLHYMDAKIVTENTMRRGFAPQSE